MFSPFFTFDDAGAGDLDLDLFLPASVNFGVPCLEAGFPGIFGVATFDTVALGDVICLGVLTGDLICLGVLAEGDLIFFTVFLTALGFGVDSFSFLVTLAADFTFFSTGENGSPALFLFCAVWKWNTKGKKGNSNNE